MKVHLITLLTTLLAATPMSFASQINDCGDSSFDNETSGGSPKVSDCQKIASNIAGGGSWYLDDSTTQRQLVQYGTCAFGARLTENGPNYIGNQDIIDLINDSISKFQSNGLVGSKGSMSCGGSGVAWALYHT
ncbi:hypothetical protein ASPZODRAFT_132589 [Penicilliopsis zonata CBS 506.65]|uniref:Ecp2 effector protein-like domain-containing protein n=1 Tax=Penicilliopsis zonata CBS 506.65 TaxID=1073090 RepID=A0A1L9SH47_9EURO|nr:hypothetical protein ASPZODRAFT_132589 [Penicilliopsis zonata CBS 506.65]OJJ46519.1 hypothetical protein ASPZODRAFT_132589 [Penicilliopsis zonata CBS 506.65]